MAESMIQEEMNMKKYSILALALVLGCSLLTGCRRGGSNMNTVPPTTQAATQAPTILPTMPTTTPPTTATEATMATDATEATMDGTENSTTDATENGSARGRAPQPNMR